MLGALEVKEQDMFGLEQMSELDMILKHTTTLLFEHLKWMKESGPEWEQVRGDLKVKQDRLSNLRVMRRQVEQVVLATERAVLEAPVAGGEACTGMEGPAGCVN